MISRLIKTSIAAALLSGTFVAASPVLAETVLRYTPSAEPKTLDPLVNWLAITHQHGYMVYDTLFSLDAKLTPQPQMVGDYSVSQDGKVYTMTLRDGLKFHDDTPVTTKDVVASINRWTKRDTIGLKLVELGMKAVAVDDKTFKVSLDVATGLLLEGFAKPTAAALFIMREKEALNDPTTPVTEIVGSGPFRFVAEEYKQGAKAVYARNEAYVPRAEEPSYLAGGKVVKVDRVEWMIMPDATTAVSALQLGEIDIYEAPPMDLVPLLETQADIKLRPLGPLGQFGFLRPNHTQPPFDKLEARKAAALLIDQAEVMSVVAGADGTYWQKCYSFLACGGVNETQAGMDWAHERNVREAKALLAKSGYAGEPVVLLAPGDNEVLKGFATVIEARLKEGGFNVDTQYSDFAAMMARRTNRGAPAEGGWNLFPMWSFTYELDNPIGSPYLNTACDGGYVGWFCSEAITAAKEQWARAGSSDDAKAAIAEIQKQASENLPIIPLGKFSSPIAFSTKVEGFVDTPIPVFWNVTVK